MHELIENLTKLLNLTPEQQFRVTAMIKREIHNEKASLCHRLSLYSAGSGIYDYTDPKNPVKVGEEPPKDAFIHGVLLQKYDSHSEWAKKSDEEIVTWSIGSHVFKQELGNCDSCEQELQTAVGYMRFYDDAEGASAAYCKPCAEKCGKWEEWEPEAKS